MPDGHCSAPAVARLILSERPAHKKQTQWNNFLQCELLVAQGSLNPRNQSLLRQSAVNLRGSDITTTTNLRSARSPSTPRIPESVRKATANMPSEAGHRCKPPQSSASTTCPTPASRTGRIHAQLLPDNHGLVTCVCLPRWICANMVSSIRQVRNPKLPLPRPATNKQLHRRVWCNISRRQT